MNKSDIKLIVIAIFVSLILMLIIGSLDSKGQKQAKVYYDNKLIKQIDLSIDELKAYTITGYNGDVVIEARKGEVRVKDEKSPLHICSRQGWVSSAHEVIVCLPNKIIIKIETDNESVDTVVR